MRRNLRLVSGVHDTAGRKYFGPEGARTVILRGCEDGATGTVFAVGVSGIFPSRTFQQELMMTGQHMS